jgi:hypothetical protein
MVATKREGTGKSVKKNRYLAQVSGEAGSFSTFEVVAETYAQASRQAKRLAGSRSFTLKKIKEPGLLATIAYLLRKAFSESKR